MRWLRAVARRWLDWATIRAPMLAGLGLGVAAAYLVANDGWMIALALILALPVLIVLHKYPFIALLGWLGLGQFLMTTSSEAERGVYWAIHRALPLATVGIIVISHAVRANRRVMPMLGRAELAMLAYLAVSILSIILLNATPLATLYRFYDRVFSPMCLYLLVRLSAPRERDGRRLAVVAFFVCAVQSTIGILSWAAPGILPSEWLGQQSERTTGSVVNAGTYTTTLIFCGLLLFQEALNREPGKVRSAYIATFMLSLFCTFLSFSRASWLGGLLVILGLIFLYPKFMARLGSIVVPTVLIIGIGGGLLAGELSYANERLNSKNTALDRLPAYFAAIRMFEEKPFFGWGYDNFDLYDRRYQARVLDFANDNKDHANHSAYLTLIAEQGLIGFALFFAPLLWWLMRTIKVLPAMPAEGFWSKKLLVILWLSILNVFIVNNFTPAWVVYGLGIWWVTLGLIANMIEAHQPDGRARISPRSFQ